MSIKVIYGGLRLGCLALLLLLASPVQGEPPAATAATVAVAHLRYREVDFSPMAWEIKVDRDVRFVKEPVFPGPKVFRGRFRLGLDTNFFVPFVWDSSAKRLYLDLNRNCDLTDDPGGVFAGTGDSLQFFRRLPLEFPSPQGPYRVLVDAHVFDFQGTPRVFLYVRSLWEGQAELSGKKWYVAIIGKPDGRLGPAASLGEISSRMILRPWAEKDSPSLWWHATQHYVESLSHVKLVTFPYRYAGNSEVFDAFNLPAKLFFQDQAYRLDCVVDAHDAPASLALSFQPIAATLGRVRIEGDFIRRLVFDSSGSPEQFTTVIDAPGAEALVPVGVYARQIARLRCEGGTNTAVGLGTNLLAVTETNMALFNGGGPLRQTVVAAAANGSASLNYRLANAADIGFHLVYHDGKIPPQLVIRQGSNQVGKGEFEFG